VESVRLDKHGTIDDLLEGDDGRVESLDESDLQDDTVPVRAAMRSSASSSVVAIGFSSRT